MTLKEWALREGLVYLSGVDYPALKDEYKCAELVHDFSHCLDCSDWYLYRDIDGTLFKYQILGDSMSVVVINESDIESLKRSDFEEEK